MSSWRAASGVAPRKVEWLWKDRIPKGFITIVAGKPDQGKGLFASHIAAEISRAGGNVLYSAAEDDASMMTRPRLEAAGADLDRVFLWRFQVPLHMSELVNHVLDNEIRLVVMDPMAAHLSGGINRHSYKIRQVTQPISELAEVTKCAFVIIEHALKRVAANSDPLAAIGGSGSGLPAAARMAYIFGTDPDDIDRKVLACAKANLRDRPKALAFEVDTAELDVVGEVASLVAEKEEVEFDARRLLAQKEGTGTPGRKPDKRADAAEWLTMYLVDKGAPVKSGDVMEDAKQHGPANKTVRRAADDMGVVRNPPGGGRSCAWSLPAEVKLALGLNDDKDVWSLPTGDDDDSGEEEAG